MQKIIRTNCLRPKDWIATESLEKHDMTFTYVRDTTTEVRNTTKSRMEVLDI